MILWLYPLRLPQGMPYGLWYSLCSYLCIVSLQHLVCLVSLMHGAYQTQIVILDTALRKYPVWALTLCVQEHQAQPEGISKDQAQLGDRSVEPETKVRLVWGHLILPVTIASILRSDRKQSERLLRGSWEVRKMHRLSGGMEVKE